jgi:UDP-N-acetylmuramate--L-alanine ligase/UDP-N-acetylenolpyruvoylglucosamine reductase
MRPRPTVLGRAAERVHLVGAGGMGMAPLALCLGQLGFRVSGEDDAWNPAVRSLLERGGVRITGPGGLPEEAELLVHSSAVSPAHDSRQRASSRGLPQLRRGEMLAEVVQGRKLVAVAGSHGKTTTTAMLITALQRAGFPCGWVLGGLFNDDLAPAHAGASDWIVAEIDESDGTIGRFSPEVTLVVNLDWDHPDHYAKLADLEAAFAALFARTRSAIFLHDACAMSGRIAARGGFAAPVHTFGRAGTYRCHAMDDKPPGLELGLGGRFAITTARVRAHGDFNAANATAALAVAQHLGAAITPESLAEFAGVRRRQAVLHAGRVTVCEDYAHHPTEISALLGSLRRVHPGRLLVVFQPHRYTRTAKFKAEFATALASADALFLLDVYAASESPVAGGTTPDLLAELAQAGAAERVTYRSGDEAGLRRALRAMVQPGDTVAFVGAGDIEQTARAFVADLQAGEARDRVWTEFLAAVRPQLGSDTRLIAGELLGPKTTMRVGGPARLYGEPATVADLQLLLREAHRRGLPVFFLGRGSNLIVPDAGVDGLVISLGHENWQTFEPQPDGRIRVGAGLRLKNLCGLATKAGLSGFEFLEGIPGSVGGALRMNAGAMGGWMFDVVEAVELMTLQGERRTMRKSEMHVDYRHCGELHDAIALGAWLRPAASGEAADIRRQIDVYQRKRVESQPREPSAGCIFKNPPGNSAGRLIDQSGLKGTRVGDAEVSTVHANFIVNRGHATSADIIALVRQVRARVKAAHGVDLEPEVLLYGAEWRDVL